MHRILGLSLMAAGFSRLAAAPGTLVRWRQALSVAAIATAILLLAVNAQAAKLFTGVVTHVSDGDTLWVLPDSGGAPRKLRLDGIDAPEICQEGGSASRRALEQAALHRQVQVQVRRRDDFDRELARVFIDGRDLGAQLVGEGQAWSYRWRRSAGPYAAEEAQARLARRGLFVDARAEPPRDFRRRNGPCATPAR
jgi:endonuclease YncB( thermonuclease family)